MKKYIADFIIKENSRLNGNCSLLKLVPSDQTATLPEILPGQFIQVKIDNSTTTFLRRPISVNFVENNELWIAVQAVGEGTRRLTELQKDDRLNLIFPLGNAFTLPETKGQKLLLIGGGVGVAPLLYLGKFLKNADCKPFFLLGARSSEDLLLIKEFEKYGEVFVTTEDGSAGEKGYVTDHSLLKSQPFDAIYTCGPKPMMISVARYAKQNNIPCEVSLENTMACGIGACLCCVEKTVKGNVCVCTEGPVFNINQLTWQI